MMSTRFNPNQIAILQGIADGDELRRDNRGWYWEGGEKTDGRAAYGMTRKIPPWIDVVDFPKPGVPDRFSITKYGMAVLVEARARMPTIPLCHGRPYSSVRLKYGFDAKIGARIKHAITGKEGVIAPMNSLEFLYVQVMFDDKNVAIPCHPTEIRYIGKKAL